MLFIPSTLYYVCPILRSDQTRGQGERRYPCEGSARSSPYTILGSEPSPYTIGSQQCVSTKVPELVTGTRFLTRVQLHLRLQGMGHENYRSADFLSVQIYVYTKLLSQT